MKFRGEFYFLSNFYPVVFPMGSLVFPTAEHAFQACKATCRSDAVKIARCGSPLEAKRLGREINLRKDWSDVRLQVMKAVLRHKFRLPRMWELLDSTGDLELVEDNHWGDTFWGRCKGIGSNHLGRLLMEIRYDFRVWSPEYRKPMVQPTTRR